jgi:ribulose-phosphate 3-epimerase
VEVNLKRNQILMTRILAPSLLSSDFLNLGKEIDMINSSEAEWVHCDIMDGHFVPNLTFGPPLLKAIRKATKKTMDVHLMISNAEQYLNEYVETGADVITLHIEAVTHLHRAMHFLKEKGVKAAVSLNPHTPLSMLSEIIHYVDMVLLMSVNPGFGGQKFIETTTEKIRSLKTMCNEHNPNCLIQVDGGVTAQNAAMLFDAGTNVLVAGNAVFGATNPKQEIEKILHAR